APVASSARRATSASSGCAGRTSPRLGCRRRPAAWARTAGRARAGRPWSQATAPAAP
ncbi:unnamed protein product, partial [Prorocentrum cordatum]